MKSKILLVLVFAVFFFFNAPRSFASPNLLTNGSFETGDFSSWVSGGNFEDTEVVSGPFYQYSGAADGSYYAVLGPVGSDGTLSQTFTDRPGVMYSISFYINAVGDNPSDFSVYWDGTELFSLTNPNTGGVWNQYGINTEIGTGSDTLTFAFRDDPGYIALDGVAVNQVGSLPEPSSLILVGTGILSLIARRKWRA
jgi:hypothetical protein